jgi:hypothetical protein
MVQAVKDLPSLELKLQLCQKKKKKKKAKPLLGKKGGSMVQGYICIAFSHTCSCIIVIFLKTNHLCDVSLTIERFL